MIMSNFKNDMPKHLAIIMDGNGRWAEKKGKNRIQGHSHGVKAVQEVVEEAEEREDPNRSVVDEVTVERPLYDTTRQNTAVVVEVRCAAAELFVQKHRQN